MSSAPEQDLTVTVAILNHRRPDLLKRVLAGIAQLDYRAFEIVVVGDQPGLGEYALPEWLQDQVRYVPFAEPNICRSRNLAIQTAHAEIVAFIDDDAVPEPTWLSELVKPFSDPMVASVGGSVRTSDGITLEWQGGTFDRSGDEDPLDLQEDIVVRTAEAQNASGRYLSLRGVNSAFRRKALVEASGFDEAIRYYLDETDMALRLAKAGWSAAIARKAEVHHLLVPNSTRGLLRKPGDQHEIGAAKAIFCKNHAPEDLEDVLSAFKRRRIASLDPQMRLGIVRTSDRVRVEQQLKTGIEAGLGRNSVYPLADQRSPEFHPFEPQSSEALGIAIETGWHPNANADLLGLGIRLAEAGHRVSHFMFRSGFHAPRVSFRRGAWHHTGGTWTLPHPAGKRPAITRAARADSERRRVAQQRRFDLRLTCETPRARYHTIELPGSRRKIAIHKLDGSSVDIEAAVLLLQYVADACGTEHNAAKSCIDKPRADIATAVTT